MSCGFSLPAVMLQVYALNADFRRVWPHSSPKMPARFISHCAAPPRGGSTEPHRRRNHLRADFLVGSPLAALCALATKLSQEICSGQPLHLAGARNARERRIHGHGAPPERCAANPRACSALFGLLHHTTGGTAPAHSRSRFRPVLSPGLPLAADDASARVPQGQPVWVQHCGDAGGAGGERHGCAHLRGGTKHMHEL